MTNNEQRIAIAEACGWVWYRMPEKLGASRLYRCLFLPGLHEYDGQSPQWTVRADMTENICNMDYMSREGLVPDYLNDLNAMHEAEKSMTQGQKTQYVFHLQTLCGGQQFGDNCFATASQRAEAFLRATGKWKV